MDTFRDLPAASLSEPPRSWRVEILPYLDSAPVRPNYKADQPWDSDENTPIAKLRLSQYVCPSAKIIKDSQERYFTAYAALTGVSSAFSDAGRKDFPKGIPDGTGETLLIAEACGRDIVWTEPRDVDVDVDPIGINLAGSAPNSSPGILSSHHLNGAHVVMADGSVKFFSQQIDPTVLKALTTIAGGEKVGEF